MNLSCCGCGRVESYDAFRHRCETCAEALEMVVPETAEIDTGRPLGVEGEAAGLWRYRSLLPPIAAELVRERISMGEGGTPLLRARRIERQFGCKEVWLKDETRNPTGSFKDRGTAVGVALLAHLGFRAVGTVSTGNMARSVAAYAARAGMESNIWVGARTPPEKLAPVAVHGARLLRFAAPYGAIYQTSMEWSRQTGVPFVNSDSALRVEGQKTIAFEVAEQLGCRAPDWMLVPTSSGGNLSAIAKGFAELAARGRLAGSCRLVAVQSAQCDPIVRGWQAGADTPVAVPEPRTIAGAISNPSPPSGGRAIRWLRQTGGHAIAVPDAEIVVAQQRLAGLSGRFVQPASAAGFAALAELCARGVIGGDDRVVVLLTGSGSNAPPPDIDIGSPLRLEEVLLEDG